MSKNQPEAKLVIETRPDNQLSEQKGTNLVSVPVMQASPADAPVTPPPGHQAPPAPPASGNTP
jgi:hypothetical protein